MPKTVLITGGAKGIGRELVEKFYQEGCNIVFSYKTSLEQAINLQDKYQGRVIATKADITQSSDIEKLYNVAITNFGGVDILINNAGVSKINVIQDIAEAEWDNVLDTNLKGAFLLSKKVVPHMVEKRYGKIINISSMWGVYGASCETHYSASKAGLIGFTKALAKEVAPSNINVIALALGLIDTDMNKNVSKEDLQQFVSEIPLQRMGTPSEVANICYFLTTDAASFITGEVIQVTGGM